MQQNAAEQACVLAGGEGPSTSATHAPAPLLQHAGRSGGTKAAVTEQGAMQLECGGQRAVSAIHTIPYAYSIWLDLSETMSCVTLSPFTETSAWTGTVCAH